MFNAVIILYLLVLIDFFVKLLKIFIVRYLFIILTSFFVQSQTEVSGIIDEETNWTVSGSPYTIIENTTFNSDLTIEAGVTVNLIGGYVRVKGKLIANGTESAIIKFTGQHGVWLDNTNTTFNQKF